MLRFRVLGRLQVLDGDTPVVLPQGKLPVLLAGLLLRANQVVSGERLVDWLWGPDQPADPRRSLHVCVTRLRQVLGEPSVIVTHPGGYQAVGSAETVDLLRVRELLEQAAVARGADPAAESALLTAALAHWEHPILPEIRSDTLRRDEIGRLDVEWAYAVERRIDADLALGRHAQLLVELASMVAEFPLRERFWAQLMTALHRSGRRADALAEYGRLRCQLAADLGTDPGPELRELHRRILAADPALDLPAAGPAPAGPAQLPTDLASFVGRAAELDRLVRLSEAGGPAVRVGVVDGMAGVGKTALAVHAAHRLAARFPDGQLFLDLHGYTDGVAAVAPAEALDRVLRSLGVPGSQIPPHLDDRAALYRSRLAASRTLVVLDNAATEEQVRPLLPGAPGCLVLVTSRRRLTGLDDAHPVSLDLLPPADAAALFTRAAGPGRVTGEPAGAVVELVDLCGRLPLAIRLAAARLRSRPAWTLTHLIQRLGDERHRLDELDVDRRSVTAALQLSCRQLTADQRRLYQLLGLHPGTEYDGAAAAALVGGPVAAVGRLLDELLDVHLLSEARPGRYRFHDLTRAHAAAAAADLPPAARDAALTRLLDLYADTATAAMDLLHPYEREQRPGHRPDAAPLPLATAAHAEAWLDAELDNLLAAAAGDRPGHTVQQAATLHRHLRTRACYGRAEPLYEHALRAARATGDRAGELTALTLLGELHRLQGRHDPAAGCYRQALAIARDTGHRAGELLALIGLGWTEALRYRHGPATAHYRRALDIAREVGHRSGELDALVGLGCTHLMVDQYGPAAGWYDLALRTARDLGARIGEQMALIGTGWVEAMQGRYEPAAGHFGGALRIARELGNRGGEQDALVGLAQVHKAVGDLPAAAGAYEEVLRIAREIHSRGGELAALAGLGQVHRAWGRPGPAAEWFDRALRLAVAAGDGNWQFEALHGLGHLSLAAGRPEEALDRQRRALELATELDHTADRARAHDGLAHAYRALGRPGPAREHWLRTLEILAGLSTEHTFDEQVTADAVRAHLAGLAGSPTARTG